VTLYIAEPVDVGGGGGERPGPLRNQLANLGPPFAQRRVRPALPRHFPPCLRAGQRPGDGDGVGLVLEPDWRTDEDVAQCHSPSAGTGRVLGKIRVDELPCAPRPRHDPVDDENRSVGHTPTVDALREVEGAQSRPPGNLSGTVDLTPGSPVAGLLARCRASALS
jgi:hypothetical protein